MRSSELIQQVMEKSGYVSELIADGTDEAEEPAATCRNW